MNLVSAVIPARNEVARIGWVVKTVQRYVDEVVVVDDASTDGTGQAAADLDATVVSNSRRKGYIGAIKSGFKSVEGEIVVTIDADGEHDPVDIPRLVNPILEERADLVLGRREEITRASERFINLLTNLKVQVADSGTGFRAMTRDLALRLNLRGRCTCGVLVLEADHYGARIVEVPVSLRQIQKERKTAWGHFWQVFYVLRWLVQPSTTIKTAKTKEA